MADPWGAITSSLYRSRKFRPLNDLERGVYIYAHTCPHRNAIGLYRLPLLWLADDLDRAPEACREALETLSNVELIDYDPEEALIRVRNWEKANAVDGPQEAIGRMQRHFDNAPEHVFTSAAFLTFVHQVLHRALGTAKGGDGWNKTEARSKMEAMIFHRLKVQFKANRADFIAGMRLAGIDGADPVFDTLWHMVSDTQTIPYDIPTGDTDTDLDTDKDTDKDLDKDTDTDTHTDRRARENHGSAGTPPPSPPAKGSRSGASQDIQDTIAELSAKAGPKARKKTW